MASVGATDVLSSTGGAFSLASNVPLIGSAWIISSAILTTYSTTKFLKYEPKQELLSTSCPKNARQKESICLNNDIRARRNMLSRGGDVGIRSCVGSSKIQQRPFLLTLYRFAGSLFLGLVFHPQFSREPISRIQSTIYSARTFLFPASMLFIANLANSIALSRIGIGLTYTSKCGIPILTVLITFLMDGASSLPPRRALLSLVPIALGIASASWNEPNFQLVGFASALASCAAQALLNVSSKSIMQKTGIKGPDAQRGMVLVALVFALGVAITDEIGKWRQQLLRSGTNANDLLSSTTLSRPDEDKNIHSKSMPPSSPRPPAWLSSMAVGSYHIEYVLSFIFVGLVEPVTYGTCDAIRRLAIILSGRAIFGGKPFSALNKFGIGMALAGALLYSISTAS